MKFLNWLFPVYSITGRGDFRPYLTRRWLIGRKRTRWALMLHKMHRPDDDNCHHDHPWNFWTLILKGGYVEEVTNSDGIVTMQINWPGTFLFRPASHTHRISALPTGTCWTLVLRSKKTRTWGFLTKMWGWMPYTDFLHGSNRQRALWCGDDE